ncbi:diacylglycerol/lipid kinase family protein, partial [Bacteroidota bacterium]
GGDGTLNEIVNGIFLQKKYPSNKITLAAISIGTGNDWSKMYNIPKDYEKAIEVIKSGQTFIQDIGLVEYNTSRSYNINVKTEKKYFINAAGLGFDAEVVFRVNKKKKEGKSSSQLSYLKDLLLSLFSYKPLLAKITVDKNQINENIFSMSIGINKYSGGGMKQLPFAIPDDGLFDITIIKNISKPDVIKNIHRLYNGTIGEHPKVITLTGESIIVESDSNIGLETDGESLGYSPFKFSIIPRSLKVVVSNDFLQND